MEMAMPCLRRPNNSSPAETVAGNEDFIAEILLRVPAQNLVMFKSVLKQWLSLISSPDFCHRHTLRNPTSTISGVFLRTSPALGESCYELLSIGGDRPSEAQLRSLDFTGVAGGDGITILQSCNGLLLCGSAHVLGSFGGFRSYYVCNPTTKRFFKLPTPISVDERVSINNVKLAFEPSKSPHYKVVCIRTTGKQMQYLRIEIYSSESRCWRACGEPFRPPPQYDMVMDLMVPNRGVFWNGAIHWISSRGTTLYVDLEQECVGTTPAQDNWGWRRFLWVGECHGHLHLIEINGPPPTRFNVYEMERDYSRWFVKSEVDLDGIAAAFPEMVHNSLVRQDSIFYAYFILSVVREENEEESSLLLHIPGKVLSYKFKDKSFKEVYELEAKCVETNGLFRWTGAYNHIKTLACV